MKFEGKRLALWFLIYYIITDVVRGFLESDSWHEALAYHSSFKILILTFSVGLIFFLITISSYAIFFKGRNRRPFLENIFWVLFVGFDLVTLRYIIEEVAFRLIFGFGNYNEGVSLPFYYLDNFYYVVQYSAIGIIFYFWQYSRFKDQSAHQLLVQNQQMELDLLRSQTNPHFLFNTLNNIYALVHKDADKALGAIERLSQLLRYSLYKTKETVLLEDEIFQVRNLIELESMRHATPPEVDITINVATSALQVPQFILLPFVENAFKHGKLNKGALPITIMIVAKDGYLNYEVRNEVQEKKKDKVGGLGLENLKKRLGLLYPHGASFSFKTERNMFIAQLKIPIK